MDAAVLADEPRESYTRCDVYKDFWTPLVERFKSVSGALSADVTLRRLQLDPQDEDTGWYVKSFPVTETIEMPIVTGAVASMVAGAGVYVRYDAVGFAIDPVKDGDEVKPDSRETYFEVKSVKEHWFLDNFAFRECQLTELPFHNLEYRDFTPLVNDARERTKTYWETYLDGDNLNNHPYIVCYETPDYPFSRVFKEKGIWIIFSIGQPTSTPDMSGDQIVRRYMESVPTHIYTLDTQLLWLGETELRRIVKDNPEGSQRSLERRGTTKTRLGSGTLYDTTFILSYRRGAS